MKKFSLSIALSLLYSASTTNAALAGAPGQSSPTQKFFGGAGVGRFTLEGNDNWKCAYDMVLVERIQGKPKTESGLFVPEEDLPKLHLCRGTFTSC